MDRASFVFALKTRVAGFPQKEELVGFRMNQVFDAINDLARIGINLEIHEALALPGDEWPKWVQGPAGTDGRRQTQIADSPQHLAEMGDGWEPVVAEAPPENTEQTLLSTEGGASGEAKPSDGALPVDNSEHPALTLHQSYMAPQPAMTDGQAISGSLATKRAQIEDNPNSEAPLNAQNPNGNPEPAEQPQPETSQPEASSEQPQ